MFKQEKYVNQATENLIKLISKIFDEETEFDEKKFTEEVAGFIDEAYEAGKSEGYDTGYNEAMNEASYNYDLERGYL